MCMEVFLCLETVFLVSINVKVNKRIVILYCLVFGLPEDGAM